MICLHFTSAGGIKNESILKLETRIMYLYNKYSCVFIYVYTVYYRQVMKDEVCWFVVAGRFL